jgi:hypothetical protein
MEGLIARIAAVAALTVLGGCATTLAVDSDVTSFSAWPAARKPSTYAFERLPSQQAQPQRAQVLEDAARRAVEAAGFVPAPPGAVADVSIQLGARVTEIDRSPFDDPFWYGPRGGFYRPFYGRYGRPFWGPGWRHGYWSPAWDTPYYEREVAVLIRDKKTGEVLYEARAHSDGNYSDVVRLLPAMYAAALKGFPNPLGTPTRVRVETATP